METTVIRGAIAEDGLIHCRLPSPITVKGEEDLDVALIKMRHNWLPDIWQKGNLHFTWDLTEYKEDIFFNNVTLVNQHLIPTDYYGSLGAILDYIVSVVPVQDLTANSDVLRDAMIFNIADFITVHKTEKMVKIVPNSANAKKIWPSDSVSAALYLTMSKDLVDFIGMSSYKRTLEFDLKSDRSVILDATVAKISQKPMCHVMMEGVKESMIGNKSRPLLYSFPQHRGVHEPFVPRFIPFKLERLGSRSDVREVTLWLETGDGNKIVLPDEVYTFQLMWRKIHG